MGLADFTPAARKGLLALFVWQCCDIGIHIIENLVSTPHALANAVWWIGVPAVGFTLKPPVARKAVIALNVLYIGFVIWFIVAYIATDKLDTRDRSFFYAIVSISQALSTYCAYVTGIECEKDDGVPISTDGIGGSLL